MDNENISTITFTDREKRLIDNCKTYAANNPAGLPGHNLMVIVAKLANLLIGEVFTYGDKRWVKQELSK